MIHSIVQGRVEVDSDGNRLNTMTLIYQYRLLNSTTGTKSTCIASSILLLGRAFIVQPIYSIYWEFGNLYTQCGPPVSEVKALF